MQLALRMYNKTFPGDGQGKETSASYQKYNLGGASESLSSLFSGVT